MAKKDKKGKKGAEPEKEEDTDAEEGGEGSEGGDEEGEDSEGGDGHGAKPAKKSKKKLFIILALVIVLLGGAGAGVYFSGILNKKKESEKAEVGEDGKPMEKPVYYTLPDFLVNLNTGGKTAAFLKASVILELPHQTDVPLVEANLPRVSDAFTTYLRELRPSDLAGSSGIQRLREELLLRVNRAIAPVKVNDVLFKDIVVQ